MSRASERREARREARLARRQARIDGRTERASLRADTRQVAYESGFDPNATLSNIVDTAGGIVSGVIANKQGNKPNGTKPDGGKKSGEGEGEGLMDWLEENQQLVLMIGGGLVATKLMKLW